MSPARILLVDDEVSLLNLLAKYLKRQGHSVETHSNSPQALESFEKAPQNFDLVVTDLGMPGMPGDKMLTRMLEIKPELLILICSGSPFSVSKLKAPHENRIAFLQKPFVPRMMADSIDRLLRQK